MCGYKNWARILKHVHVYAVLKPCSAGLVEQRFQALI
jgi:hypothetical protein